VNRIVTGLFDIFFILGGIWVAGRITNALRSGCVRYGSGLFARSEHPWTFWIAVIGYAVLVFGAVYGILLPWGL
jgi:hypothetical protein